jgi:hypothetical protein
MVGLVASAAEQTINGQRREAGRRRIIRA